MFVLVNRNKNAVIKTTSERKKNELIKRGFILRDVTDKKVTKAKNKK